MKGLMLMYSNKWKKIGIIISAVSLLMMVAERVKGFIIFRKYDASQHYDLFQWCMLLGLVCIIYSKEKYDDDRAKMIRLKSLQIAFLILLSVLMSIGLTGALHTGKSDPIQPEILLDISAVGIILYLLIYHIGLYFDFLWEFEDTEWTLKAMWANFRTLDKNIWGMLAYLIASAVTILLVTLLNNA
jgi:hypothetical protein